MKVNIVDDNLNDKFINPFHVDKVLDSEMFKCEKCDFHSSKDSVYWIQKSGILVCALTVLHLQGSRKIKELRYPQKKSKRHSGEIPG